MKIGTNKLHSFSGEKFQATRPLDYIYDPVFTFSGPKDYYKTAHESHQASSEFSVQPIFNSMFSDMVRYPRATLVLRPAHRAPHSIDTSYKGKIKAISQERTVTSEVSGVDRYKYFRRPVTEVQIAPPASAGGTRTLLGVHDNVTQLGITAPPATAEKVLERSSRLSAVTQTRAAQTDYRESEAQTLPWTPPFTSQGRDTPEVLRLDQLSWGHGLPPGQHEVEIVERLRMKKAWESQLPPLTTEANTKKRFKLISDMEQSDWNFRAKEIQTEHDERMKKSEKLLEQHVLQNRTRLSYRMEFLEDDINKRKEIKLQLSRRDKERALRKLCMKEKGYNPKQHKQGAVVAHLHRSSDVYAPMKRNGMSFKNRHEVLSEKHITITGKDIYTLENAVEYRPVFDYNKQSQPKKQTELCVRETRWTADNLAKLHKDLRIIHDTQHKKSGLYFYQVEELQKNVKDVLVPSVPLTNELKENLYQTAILIHRVIHGRAVQTQVHQNRIRWKEVMEELTSTQNVSIKQMSLIYENKDRLNIDTRLHGIMENIVGQNVGLTIGHTLNLLADELLRYKSMGVAHTHALQAECARWRREVPESGRRQKEMRRRDEHNLMFSQLLEAYQLSINEFMEAIIVKAREHEAKTEAYEYAKELARLAELRKAEEEKIDTEPVSADLLFAYIAPDGLRELTRACMIILKLKYEQSHQTLVNTGRAEPLPPESEPDKEVLKVSAQERRFTNALSQLSMFPSVLSYSYPPSEVTEYAGDSNPDQNSVTHDTMNTSFFGLMLDPPTLPPVLRFGLVTPPTPEERLLSKIMRDMCYIAGKLLHTASKILNKAIQLSGIPQESFEEALRRTMQVISGAQEEIIQLIFPRRESEAKEYLLPSQIAPPEVIAEATKIIDSIISQVKERLAEINKKHQKDVHFQAKTLVEDVLKEAQHIHFKAKTLVEDVIKEAQRTILQTVVEDFLLDLFEEARIKVTDINKEEES